MAAPDTEQTPESAAERAFAELGIEGRIGNLDPEEGDGTGPDDDPDDSEDPDDADPDDDLADEDDDGGDEGDGGDGDGAEEDEDAGPGNRLEVSDSDTLILQDGTEVSAKDAALFQADYTRKTQAVAEQKQQLDQEREELNSRAAQVDELFDNMKSWYETRAADPGNWIVEIASQSDNPTRSVARALKGLADQGRLDEKFVEMFGLESGPVADVAAEDETSLRLAQVEQTLQERQQEEETNRRIQQIAGEYQQQWDSIKASQQLAFDSPDAERQAKREVLEFARDRDIVSLEDAYDLLAARKAREAPAPPKADPETTDKKRASRAVTPRSASGGAKAKPAKRGKTNREAAEIAMAKFAAQDA